MNTFVIGDIHGAHKALIQCLERAQFSYAHDRLIVLGDVCDGYPDVKQSIDELLKIRHCDYILGNHDKWALDWALTGWKEDLWLSQGGRNTVASYGGQPMPKEHAQFLNDAKYWIEEDNKIFVHGGFDPDQSMVRQDRTNFLWDRSLLQEAYKKHAAGINHTFGDYTEIYVGHTPTQVFHTLEPLHCCNVWAMDTGAGWSGKLTIMNIATKQFWQSDFTPTLYEKPAR